jgi:apolipoprotein N-acyltransferase
VRFRRRSRIRRSRWAGALIGGLALGLGFQPWDLWWLAPFGVALHARAVRGGSLRESLWLTLGMSLLYFAPIFVWERPVGTDAWLALTLLEAVVFLPLGPMVLWVQRTRSSALGIALVWVIAEAIRDRYPFGGLGWGRLAFAQTDGPLLAWARWGGAPLVSFMVAISGALLLSPRRRVALALLPWVVGALLPIPSGQGARTVQVAVVQGNVPRLGLDFDSQRRAVLDNHVTATLELAARVKAGTTPKPDLVIWPENSSDVDPFRNPDAAAQLTRAAQAMGESILVGAVLDGPGRYVSNTGLVWTPTGPDGQRYVKRHPVPFGEYLPFRTELTALISEFNRIPRDFIHGEAPGHIVLNGVRVADVICFEIAYDGLVRSAVADMGQLLVVQTNNATFGRYAESTQQLAMVRFRAVEHGRSAAMASTSGTSALVTPAGKVLASSGIFRRAVLVRALPLRSGHTPSDVMGGWVLLTMVLIGSAIALTGAGSPSSATRSSPYSRRPP